MTETFATPDDFGEPLSSELHTSLGESLGTQFGGPFFSGSRTILGDAQYLAARSGAPQLSPAGAGMGEGAGFVSSDLTTVAPLPDVPIGDFKARVKQEGLEGHVKVPDQDTIRPAVANLMIQDAHEQVQRAAAVNRGPQGFLPDALGFLTSVGAGMIDPINAAAFAIPLVGGPRLVAIVAEVRG